MTKKEDYKTNAIPRRVTPRITKQSTSSMNAIPAHGDNTITKIMELSDRINAIPARRDNTDSYEKTILANICNPRTQGQHYVPFLDEANDEFTIQSPRMGNTVEC